MKRALRCRGRGRLSIHRSIPVAAVLLVAARGFPAGDEPPALEVFEAGEEDTSRLLAGKEADGIIGDFVLRNAHVEALISGPLPGRKANMTTHYDADAPGSIYDLCVTGSRNDQLTLFAPGDLRGPVSSVVASHSDDGKEAEVIVERTAARGGGKAVRHRYVLRDGWKHVLVVSEYSNASAKDWKVEPAPFVKGLLDPAEALGIHWADSMNPEDRQGYAWAPVEHPGAEPGWDPAVLARGGRRTGAIAVAPGRSPAEAFGVIAALREPAGTLEATIHEGKRGIPTATLRIWLGVRTSIPAYADRSGRIAISLPPGSYSYAATDDGRPPLQGTFAVKAGEKTVLDLPMSAASGLSFEVTDAAVDGKKSPCKVQITGVPPTRDPELGVMIQAHGCANQYHAENGWFDLPLDPGTYRVIITRGIEYAHFEKELSVAPGKWTTVAAQLRRVVDTAGHVSTDFHNHSTPSGDNYCGTDDRLINLAAEHVEFAPTTEHNRFYDWKPHLERLGLADEVITVPGIELTGRGAHLNAFPFQPTPWTQDNGAPTWRKDPRINAIALRDFQGGSPDRWVQVNHPQVGEFFRDRDADGVPDGGYPGLEALIDAAEVWSTEILNHQPWLTHVDRKTEKTSRYANRTFAWLQLLNQDRLMSCVAVSDAHSVFGNGTGSWRTYVPSSADDPAAIDPREIIRNAKAGRMVVTNGPYLEVRMDDGTIPGGHTRRSGTVEVQVEVQCTSWIDIDRVQVLVNGRMPESLDFTRKKHPKMFGDRVVKFDHKIAVPLAEDSHVIVAVMGEGFDLRKGYGASWQSTMKPCAFSNPIFVDTDGGGFEANGDTLGHPLPTGRE